MTTPLVSIIINNYNYGGYVAASIESALAQDYPYKEVIVVDDGSTDDSRSQIESYRDKILPVLKQNGGQASCFNEGFARSKGEIICFLDSDDVFLPGKVQTVVDIFTSTLAEWCFHSVQWTDVHLNLIPGPPPISYSTGNYDFRAEVLNGRCAFRPPATSGLAFLRSLLQVLLPMPEQIRITSDNYIKLSAVGLAPGHFISDRLTLQRMHGSNLYTAKRDDGQRAAIQLATAISMRSNFPTLRKNCNRMFAHGIVDKWKAGSTVESISEMLKHYIADLPLTEKSDILARVLVRAVKQSLSSSNA